MQWPAPCYQHCALNVEYCEIDHKALSKRSIKKTTVLMSQQLQYQLPENRVLNTVDVSVFVVKHGLLSNAHASGFTVSRWMNPYQGTGQIILHVISAYWDVFKCIFKCPLTRLSVHWVQRLKVRSHCAMVLMDSRMDLVLCLFISL